MLDRDRIVESVDLASLADELLGPRRRAGPSATWPCPSPQHAQTGRTPPVSIFRGRSGEERWHCHGCGIGGTAVDLVMTSRRVAVREALDELAGRAGLREGSFSAAHAQLRRHTPRRPPSPGPDVADPDGLASFVGQCADRLWQPAGLLVLRWLTEVRGLPEDVLKRNRIGADSGRRAQDRPDGMPSAGRAAVLPIHQAGRPIFAQLRPISPAPGRPRYLNAATRLAANPRVGVFEPAERTGACVVVTEGVLDALSANAAGLTARAVLGAALVGGGGPSEVGLADRLAEGGRPILVAFDSDQAGEMSATALVTMLRDRGARVGRLRVPAGAKDVNEWMCVSGDWTATVHQAARAALSVTRPIHRRLS